MKTFDTTADIFTYFIFARAFFSLVIITDNSCIISLSVVSSRDSKMFTESSEISIR